MPFGVPVESMMDILDGSWTTRVYRSLHSRIRSGSVFGENKKATQENGNNDASIARILTATGSEDRWTMTQFRFYILDTRTADLSYPIVPRTVTAFIIVASRTLLRSPGSPGGILRVRDPVIHVTPKDVLTPIEHSRRR